jgi:RNA polymerase sigma factor (sigma-70 family)
MWRVIEQERLAERFEQERPHLRSVAYRMLGSIHEADEAVQETWVRLSTADAEQIEHLGGWLTTVVSRVCLNLLRSRKLRSEQPLDVHVPEPVISGPDGMDPEHEALLGDSVGLALNVVLDTLRPAERLAYVLHDMFDVPFEDVAPLVDRSPAAARQLASRARRRVEAEAPKPDADAGRQREAVDAFFAAAREGEFDALVAVLDPAVVLRTDGGPLHPERSVLVRGAETVAQRALMFAHLSPHVRPALINGAAGVVVAPEGRPFSVMAFTVVDGRIAAIDTLADPDRLAQLDISALAH